MDVNNSYNDMQIVENFNDFVGYLSIKDYSRYLSWRESVKASQKSQEQTLSTTQHNNHSNHSNHNDHYDNTNHSDSNTHSNIGGYYNHINSTIRDGYSNSNEHYNYGTTHTDIPHLDSHTHTNNVTGTSGTHYNKSHTDRGGHTNGYAHGDKSYTNHTNTDNSRPHSDSNPHSNNSNHSDYAPHSNNTYTTNVGFDHSNYIPFKPDVNISGETVRDTYELVWYSYDKNQDGFGTQDTVSKNVKYYSKLRKIKNLDGSSSVSGWRTLADGTLSESYSLNTIDPLNVGNTEKKKYEGIYEIELYSINDTISRNGVTKSYTSPTRTAYFTIRQNYDPKITVTNGNEFVNFNLGIDTKVSNDGNGNIVTYDSPQGLTVKFLLTDSDVTDYHKGQVYLSYGSDVITSKYNVSFSGTNSSKTGTAFIPKADYLNDGALKNVIVNIDVKDYTDSAMYVEAGGHLIQQKISENGAIMSLGVDNNYPTILIDNPSALWTDEVDVNIDISDKGLGIKECYYQIVDEFGTWNNSKWIAKTSSNFNVTLKDAGKYKIAVKAIDKAGNETIRMTSVFKVSPIKVTINTTPSYPNFIPASENLQVEVLTESFVDVNKVEIWLENNTGNKINLGTLDIGERKKWNGEILIPSTYIDNEYTLFVKSYRYDGSYKNTTTPIKVFTPIGLNIISSPIVELDKEFSIEAETTKYPIKTETKLFVGTPYETGWLNMTSKKVNNHLEWIKKYTASNIPKNTYTLAVKSTLPNGKTETKTIQMFFTEIENTVKHTDEWERKRKAYNLAKSGNENSPRSNNVFFNGEKFILETKVEVSDPTLLVDSIKVEILDTEYATELESVDGVNWKGSIWDSSMMYKWGIKNRDELTFKFTVYYNRLDMYGNRLKNSNDVKVIVDDVESYYELHRDS